MTFFTPERLSKAQKGNDPAILSLFCEDKDRKLRKDLDRRLAQISEKTRVAVSRKLERCLGSMDNFRGIYHELVVGSLLTERGFSLDYEPAIHNQTPDWRVTDPEGNEFLLEVVERRGSGPTDMGVLVKGEPLRNTIRDKIWKYSGIAKQFSLVVAVFMDSAATGLMREELEQVLTGEKGLFKAYPSLSGCFHVDAGDGGFEWRLEFMAHPELPINSGLLLSRPELTNEGTQ